VKALSFAEVQEQVRAAFCTLADWTGLPIDPDRLDGRTLLSGEGRATLLKFESAMIGPGGALGEFAGYTPSIRRFLIQSVIDAGVYRVSRNSLGVMINPTELAPLEFAHECYLYLLAHERGDSFEAGWLADPVLWPKTLNRSEDLAEARNSIADLRPGETVVRAGALFGDGFIARYVPGTSWRDLDWHAPDGASVDLVALSGTPLGGLRSWRAFLNGFLRHAVGFSLDAEGRRANGHTKGLLRPAPILLVGHVHTGRTEWADGRAAEVLARDSGEWGRVVAGLTGRSEEELEAGGLHPRTVRAMRAGRRPTKRNADAARRLVARKARVQAGLEPGRELRCIAPGCEELLTGRQRLFCTTHASYPGKRRRQWKESR
jgi:hypothetical protein